MYNSDMGFMFRDNEVLTQERGNVMNKVKISAFCFAVSAVILWRWQDIYAAPGADLQKPTTVAQSKSERQVIKMTATTPHIVGTFDAKRSELLAKQGEAGILVYGPYLSLSPGKYRVRFILTVSGKGKIPVASVDVAATADGKMNVPASLDVNPAPKEQVLTLDFESSPKSVYEFRVLTKGNAQVAVREIVLDPL
ncbi:MAG: hypothetical protein PHE55_01885 [Methylococcaceae bacterium]|nr:hypothetical protein [Methylococcaceae bacterium]